MDSLRTEVLIAGGGPCGLMLAIELGRRGVRCLLVDPKRGTAAFEQAARDLKLDLRVARHAAPGLAALYEAPLALIRPDQIMAWRGRDARQAPAVLAQASGRTTLRA